MSSIKLKGSSSGDITISAPAVAGTNTLTLPASSGEITIGGNNTPSFVVRLSSAQTISDNTATKVAFDTEDVDTDTAFASNKFTVPSGKAGLYKFDVLVRVASGSDGNLLNCFGYLYKNGTANHIFYNDYQNNNARAISISFGSILNLSEGDYIEVYVAGNTADNSSPTITHNKYSVFSGHKLIS